MTLRVDAHVHLYNKGHWPPSWFDFVATKWASSKSGRQPSDIRGTIEDGMSDPSAERMLSQMDAAGIDVAVILTVDWELGMNSTPAVPIEEVHRCHAEVSRQSGGRLLLFAGVDPRRPEALDILTKAKERDGVCGYKLYPPVGVYPYEDVVHPLYEACQAWGLPVAIHTGATLGKLRPRFANPLYIQDVQRDFPDLTLWIAHAGAEWWWDEAVAVAKNGVDTYLELSSWQPLAFSDEREFVKRLARAIDTLGAERLMFGSDHISGSKVRGSEGYLRWTDWFRELPTTGRKYGETFRDEQVEAIMGGNAARCLGLKGPAPA